MAQSAAAWQACSALVTWLPCCRPDIDWNNLGFGIDHTAPVRKQQSRLSRV